MLRYYASAEYKHWIFIGDSSDAYHAERTQKTVKAFKSQLNIRYFSCPAQSPGACIETLNRSLTTPYSAAVSDDDFVSPSGIDQCVEFLEHNPEFSAAHGKGIYMGIRESGPYGAVHETNQYPQAQIEGPTGADRLVSFFTVSMAALLHSVHRNADWQEMFRGISDLKSEGNNNIFKDELIPCAVAVTRGKIKQLEGLYFVRFFHDAIYRQISMYDWITNPNWFPSYQFLCQRITEELIRQDGINKVEAQEVIKRAFWPYLSLGLSSGWQNYTGHSAVPENSEHNFRLMARRVPGLRSLWHRARFARQKLGHNELSLPALLNPSSPYHADFMLVYQVTTTPPSESTHEPFS